MQGSDLRFWELDEPIHQISKNAGWEASIVVQKVKDGKDDFGFDARSEEFKNLLKAGILDPTKLARTALENAASIAGLLLTTECAITDKPEPAAPVGPPMDPGMSGMY